MKADVSKHTLPAATDDDNYYAQKVEYAYSFFIFEEFTRTSVLFQMSVFLFCEQIIVAYWLLNVSVAWRSISGVDLLRQV